MPSVFMKVSMVAGPECSCTMHVQPRADGPASPVGVRFTSKFPEIIDGFGLKPKDLVVQDFYVGKNSQTANAGEFNHRLMDGRRLFSFDETNYPGIASCLNFTVRFFNPNKTEVNVEMEVEFDNVNDCRSGFLLFAPLRKSQYFSSAEEAISALISGHDSTTPKIFPLVPGRSVEWSAHTQMGGVLREMVVLPEILPELESGELSIKVEVYDVDVHNRNGGPQEAPGTRRCLSFKIVDGRLLFDGDSRIWANEIAVLTVENKSVLEVYSKDLLIIMEPVPELCTLDGRRYNDRPGITEEMGLEKTGPGKWWTKRPGKPDQH